MVVPIQTDSRIFTSRSSRHASNINFSDRPPAANTLLN